MEYTSEQLNYFRICYIAFNLVPEGLRKVFKQEWEFRYKTTRFGEWKDTLQNGRDFFNSESRRSHVKNARYLATIQNGNTAEWDSSCLLFAILYSDSIGSTLSPAVNKNVDDLRQVRNDIAHISEAELTDIEFHNCVGRVLASFNSLKLPVKQIEDVKNQRSFPTAEESNLNLQADNLRSQLKQAKADLQCKNGEVKTLTSDLEVAQNTLQSKQEEVETLTQEINLKVESFCSLTFKPSHEIIRRSKDVARIMTKMEVLENESNGAVSTIYLSGNPGCGKSQIARQVGQEVFDKRSCKGAGLTFVATLNAETLESIANSYFRLARQLKITEYTLTNLATAKMGCTEETIQHLIRLILPQMKQFSGWLIIADNVVDLSLVRSYLPPTGSEEWGNGQVIITTQDSSTIPCNAPHTYHESFREGMLPDDALELLKQVSQISNQKQAEKVAEVLEYQPLALAAAAFYVQTITCVSPSYSWTDYLETLNRGERDATEEPLAEQNLAYSKTMTTAVNLAIKRAVQGDKVLRETFCLFSLCASDPLPIEAAVNFVKSRTTVKTVELIRAKILRSSLISCFFDDDGEPSYLRVHNIVQDELRTIFKSELESKDGNECIYAAIKTFHSLIEAECDQLFSSQQVCIKLRRITTHCKELHEIVATNFEQKDQTVKEFSPFMTVGDVVSWLCSVAKVCCDLSNPSTASLFSTSSLEFVKYISSTEEGDALKAKVFNVHGDVLLLQCKYESAITYFEQARIIYGDDHTRLGSAYHHLGQYSQAKEHLEKALIIAIEVYGEQHPNVAASYTNLGNVYSHLKQHCQAKELHEKALIIGKEVYGEHHAHVATSYNSLGRVYNDLGHYNQAKEHYEKALIITKEVYGEQHAQVAAVYCNLGVVHSDLGHHSQSKEYHEKALTIGKAVYGQQHGHVAASFNFLGCVYKALGQYDQAKEQYSQALISARAVYGDRQADVAVSYSNLGVICSELGQHNQAKEHHQKALIIRKEVYGEQHPDVAASYSYLGNVYRVLGQNVLAQEHYEKALTIRKEVYGEQHPDLAASYNNLGGFYNDIGHYKQAKDHHEKALIIRKEVYGEQHPDVAESYNNLGNVYKALGQHSQAKKHHEKALFIREEIYGERHPDVAASYNNLGNLYKELAQHSKAKEQHEKALFIRTLVYGEQHPDVAASYNNLGNLYKAIGQHSKAKEHHEKALSVRKQFHGDQHADVADSYNNLGIVYCELKQHSQAKELFEKALIIRKGVYGEQHPHVAASYGNLGNVYRALGQYIEAQKHHEKSLLIRREVYGEQHPDVAASYNNLAIVFSDLGQYSQAREQCEKALSIYRKVYGEQHAVVEMIFRNLRIIDRKLLEHDQSKN